MSQVALIMLLYPIYNLKVSTAHMVKSVLVMHVNVQKVPNSETAIVDRNRNLQTNN